MKKIIAILILVTSFFSCDNKFPDFIEKDEGVYMKLLSFEEDGGNYLGAAHVAASIEMYGDKSLLYKRYKEDVISIKNNELAFLIQYLNEGDSCTFMVSKNKIIEEFNPIKFNETTSDYVKVSIKIHRYFTRGEYLSEKQWYDKEMMEQLILTKYLKEVDAKLNKGVYVKQLEKGKGKRIKKGDVITIAYKGCFINQLQFDEISGSTAFTFTYGTPGQVIEGLDLAINGMKKGEKSKIIIPSQLAFGEEGSTTLIVSSFTTVIYELKIVNVK